MKMQRDWAAVKPRRSEYEGDLHASLVKLLDCDPARIDMVGSERCEDDKREQQGVMTHLNIPASHTSSAKSTDLTAKAVADKIVQAVKDGGLAAGPVSSLLPPDGKGLYEACGCRHSQALQEDGAAAASASAAALDDHIDSESRTASLSALLDSEGCCRECCCCQEGFSGCQAAQEDLATREEASAKRGRHEGGASRTAGLALAN